jgi:Mn2+/Fe2+ NRAMP family transporter
MLVAATGVGAGDLLTASLAGSRFGLTLLWAAWMGALLKWFLNEGIARWQMATGTTLVEGWIAHLGQWVRWAFGAYLVAWAVFTGGALASACGVAGTGILPIGDPATSKIVWGVIHSLLGLLVVWRGGFRIFARFMAVCTGLMFVSVVVTAVLLRPDLGAIFAGLTIPSIPSVPSSGTAYTLGVLGGVGGTVTLLSYGYWIRERGRAGLTGVAESRIDLATGYAMTAVFGLSMIVVGSRVTLQQGPTAALELAGQLAVALGPAGKWILLVGFWAAVFSSLLGVWQSAPYLFADLVTTRGAGAPRVSLELPAYRISLLFIATAPLVLLWTTVERAQLLYAVFGSLFMPALALTLLVMNNRTAWVGREFRTGWVTNAALVVTLALFAWIGGGELVAAVRQLLR